MYLFKENHFLCVCVFWKKGYFEQIWTRWLLIKRWVVFKNKMGIMSLGIRETGEKADEGTLAALD